MRLSLIISTYNRTKLFGYVLRSLVYQTFPRNEMEIVVVDDGSTEDTLGVLKYYKPFLDCKIQYIRIDSKLCDIPVKYHTPALTNNVGFRNATGDVFLIQGNDVMHLHKDNLVNGYNHATRNLSVFAELWECNEHFIRYLDVDEEWKKNTDLSFLYFKPGAKFNNIHMTNWYWYILFVRNNFVNRIQGVDEEYLRGVYAEDDNFARRLTMAGTTHYRDLRIKGLHLWHYDEHLNNPKQKRWNQGGEWERAAEVNRKRWREFCADPELVANVGRDWGSSKVIVEKIIL